MAIGPYIQSIIKTPPIFAIIYALGNVLLLFINFQLICYIHVIVERIFYEPR